MTGTLRGNRIPSSLSVTSPNDLLCCVSASDRLDANAGQQQPPLTSNEPVDANNHLQ